MRTRTSTKCDVREAGEAPGIATTTGCPWWWWHGRASWHARSCVPLSLDAWIYLSLFGFLCDFLSVLAVVLSLKEHVFRPNFNPFDNHSHSHRIARSRLERKFEGEEEEEEDLQSDGGLSKNRKIKRSHLTKHFFLFSSLLLSHV